MELIDIEKEALTSDRPVVKNMYTTDHSKLVAIGMKGGVVLKEHTALSKTKLMVLKGEIDFNTATESIRLAVPDSLEIPLDVTHSVEAYDDTLFLLLFEKGK